MNEDDVVVQQRLKTKVRLWHLLSLLLVFPKCVVLSRLCLYCALSPPPSPHSFPGLVTQKWYRELICIVCCFSQESIINPTLPSLMTCTNAFLVLVDSLKAKAGEADNNGIGLACLDVT
jgi:hypothetical protein